MGLQCSVPVTVHINFRSQQHAAAAKAWLQAQGWGLNLLTRSTVSTGVPHGPYSGPVYSKQCTAGQIDLMGSNCKEGTYLVFVELPTQAPAAAQQPASDNKPELHQKQEREAAAVKPAAAAAVEVAAATTKVETQPASSPQPSPQQPKQQLQEMGLNDTVKLSELLLKHQGNTNLVVR